jgi:hypothetical protein
MKTILNKRWPLKLLDSRSYEEIGEGWDVSLCRGNKNSHHSSLQWSLEDIKSLPSLLKRTIQQRYVLGKRGRILKYCYDIHFHRFLSYPSHPKFSEPGLTKKMKGEARINESKEDSSSSRYEIVCVLYVLNNRLKKFLHVICV